MLVNLANIIGWTLLCLIGLWLIGVLITLPVLMVSVYRVIKQDMKKFKEREKRIEERSDKMFRGDV
jgi:hypothetical protein